MRSLVPCLAAAGVLVLASCASTVDVRGIGSAGGPAVYKLSGHDLASLNGQAQRLCRSGHTVVAQWQQLQRAEVTSGLLQRGWVRSLEFLGALPGDQATMTVQCNV